MGQWHTIQGTVIKGHRVASGPSDAYPYGTLGKQKPYFKALGLDLDQYFEGTLNISIAPRTFEMKRSQYTFPLVEWTDLHPPETFSFSACRLHFAGDNHDGWVYFPHPETKTAHFQNPSVVEVISHRITGITYGDPVILHLNRGEIIVT